MKSMKLIKGYGWKIKYAQAFEGKQTFFLRVTHAQPKHKYD